MVDIETLGTRPGSVILSIGACRFDETGVGERFYRPIDVLDALMSGLTTDQATIGWWRMQSLETRGALKPGLPLAAVLEEFRAFLGREPGFVWAKGPDFDLVMLDAAYQVIGERVPWSYRNARDVRTILALAPALPREAATPAHHALGDAVYQAQQVIVAAKQLGVALSEMV